MENNKNKKSVKFQGDVLNFCDFIQVFVFTRNHHLNLYSVLITGTPTIFIPLTVVYLSIGTPKNNKFFIYPKWNINNFWVSHNLGTLLPNYNVLK